MKCRKIMSTRSQLTKDLNESIKSSLGNKVKILFKNVVRLETKGDKTENRVLVFSPCRILLLTAKVPTKIDCHFHYLEIQALESKRGNQLSLTINEKIYSFLTGDDSTCSLAVDSMLSALNNAIRNIFPTVPLQHIIKKIEVIPNTRLQQLRDLEAIASSRREVGPCGGFAAQYACMCDYHSIAYREEVAWDMDNIYGALNTRELCLKDFDYLEQKDLVPIIGALEYNTWFTKLRTNQIRLSHDNLDRVLQVVRKSLNLETLHMDNLGLKADFVNKLTNAIKLNAATALHTIDLSFNPIEDKGGVYLAGGIARLNKGIVHVNLSHCGISAKGLNHVATALNTNTAALTTLNYLNFSGNTLKDDISSLYGFLSQPNALQHIDISGTDILLENFFSALSQGCTTNLVHLNVSRNPFNSKKSNKDAPVAFKQFFSATLNLKYLNMAQCKLPQEALKNLLLGLACNEYTKDLTLDISNNNLGGQGAHVLESCLHGVRCLSSLDISENGMDGDLAGVILAASRNRSLRHLSVNRCMRKHMSVIVDALVQVVQDDECRLRTLQLADCRLRSDMCNLLNALGDNRSLETLDIAGNLMGDTGMRLLAKALQINRTLQTINYDRNGTSLQGYSDIAYALETNTTLQYMPFPLHDVAAQLNRAGADRIDVQMHRIHDLLNRNVQQQHHNTNRMRTSTISGDHRSQSAVSFLLMSKQQALERLVGQTRDAIHRVDSVCDSNDVNHAQSVMEDAHNTKLLLVRIQEAVQINGGRGDDDGGKEEELAINAQLDCVANDVHNTISDYIQRSLDKMVKCCRTHCPYVLHDEHRVDELKKASHTSRKQQVSQEFIANCLKQHTSSELLKRVRNVCQSMATDLCEQVVDEVYDTLIRSYRILMGDACAIRIESPPRRSRLSSSDSSRHRTSDVSITDTSSHVSDHSPIATPHLSIKRHSMHGRKLRPKSVVDDSTTTNNADLDFGVQQCAPLSDVIPSQSIATTTNSYNNEEEEDEDSISELPGSSGAICLHQPLQHLVKGRPRRAKTRAPSRPLVRNEDVSCDSGFDTFFRPGSVTPTGVEPPPLVTSPSNTSSTTTTSVQRGVNENVADVSSTPRSKSSDNLAAENCTEASVARTAISPTSSLGDSKLKLRPWSMVHNNNTHNNSDVVSKSSDLTLSGENTSSTNNTPDSMGSNTELAVKPKTNGVILRSYLPDPDVDLSFLLRSRKVTVLKQPVIDVDENIGESCLKSSEHSKLTNTTSTLSNSGQRVMEKKRYITR